MRSCALLVCMLGATPAACGGASAKPSDAVVANTAASAPRLVIGREAVLRTPICLGFVERGTGGYLLTRYSDRSIPHWTLDVRSPGGAPGSGIQLSLKTTDDNEAVAAAMPFVDETNSFLASRNLSPCVAWPIETGTPPAARGG